MAVGVLPVAACAQDMGFPAVLPADFERSAALAAAPAALRDAAGVYLLGPDGFVEDRPSRNGFTCLVVRDASTPPAAEPERQVFAPQCFDAVATRSVMQRQLDIAGLIRQDGISARDALRRTSGDAAQRYTPSGPGIVYMASALNRVPNTDDPEGPFQTYAPHVMFLAPNTPDQAVSGGLAGTGAGLLEGWPFMVGPPRPTGMIAMPVDRELQRRIVDEQADLVREAERYVPTLSATRSRMN